MYRLLLGVCWVNDGCCDTCAYCDAGERFASFTSRRLLAYFCPFIFSIAREASAGDLKRTKLVSRYQSDTRTSGEHHCEVPRKYRGFVIEHSTVHNLECQQCPAKFEGTKKKPQAKKEVRQIARDQFQYEAPPLAPELVYERKVLKNL